MKNYKRDEDTVLKRKIMKIKKQNVVRRAVSGSKAWDGVRQVPPRGCSAALHIKTAKQRR
jgi:hypothetical protein